MNAKKLVKFKKILLEEKERILNHSQQALKTELVVSTDDLKDETDLAATEISQNLVFRLRDRERMLMMKIEAALARIEEGSFGTCDDCEETIEERRLEARPVSTLCLSCKELEERRERVYA